MTDSHNPVGITSIVPLTFVRICSLLVNLQLSNLFPTLYWYAKQITYQSTLYLSRKFNLILDTGLC